MGDRIKTESVIGMGQNMHLFARELDAVVLHVRF